MSMLFTPYEVGNLHLENRIVLPPMATFGHKPQAGAGFVADSTVAHYSEAAKSRPGLMIVESTAVQPKNPRGTEQLGIWCEAQIEGHRRIAEAIHAENVPCLLQIQTSGVTGKNEPNPMTVSAYDSDMTGRYIKGRAMTVEEIHAVQARFVEAAVRAQQAGYDGVELHAAHGYFLCQTLSPLVNKRTDCYGGSLANRARIITEIAEEIRRRCGKDFFLAIRMGVNDPDPEAAAETIGVLKESGIQLFDLSRGFLEFDRQAHPLEVPADFPFSRLVYAAKLVKEKTQAPIIFVGGLFTPKMAEDALQAGAGDLAAIGRNFLIEPAWPEKARRGEPIQTCYDCKTCQWFTDASRCPAVRKKNLAGA